MTRFFLLLHTIVHLKIKQIAYQLFYRLHQPEFSCIAAEGMALHSVRPIEKYHCYNSEIFIFLNISAQFNGWNDTRHGMLWTYNLNYMDWLLQEEMTYEKGAEWIDKFIDDLPENYIGLAPYPIALRGINWIKFMSRHRQKIDGNHLHSWNENLYSQYTLLTKKLEYHLMGNHLLEDVFSLFIASLYFSKANWYRKYSDLLKKELEEQILPDGAHYEQSPMYHCILLDRLLDCYNFSVHNIRFKNQAEFNSFLQKKIIEMLGHLESITYRDGNIPLLNDSAYGIAPTPAMLKDYAQRLGLIWKAMPMRQCGYRKLNTEQIEVIVDIGNITASYQPGHTHADIFNYEMRISGDPFVVDTGISTYEKNSRRQYERSSAAHNCVVVSGKNSSEVWGGFRVGKRAKVFLLADNNNFVEARHNGYVVSCYRRFSLSEEALVIQDKIDIQAISYIHLAPGVEILSASKNKIRTDRAIIAIEGSGIIDVLIKKGKVSTRYNTFQDNLIIEIHFSNVMCYTITPNQSIS